MVPGTKYIFVLDVHTEHVSLSNVRINYMEHAPFEQLRDDVDASARYRTISAHYTKPSVRCDDKTEFGACRICHCAICMTYPPNIKDMKDDSKNHFSVSKIGKWPAGIIKG